MSFKLLNKRYLTRFLDLLRYLSIREKIQFVVYVLD